MSYRHPINGHVVTDPAELLAEHRLNEAFALATDDAAGEEMLGYLSSLTINKITGPGMDPNALIHLEGARWLFGIIKARAQLGREGKPEIDHGRTEPESEPERRPGTLGIQRQRRVGPDGWVPEQRRSPAPD